MANLNIKSNNDKTIAKIDCKGIFIFNTTGCKENSIYLNENVDVYYNDIDFIRNNKYINSISKDFVLIIEIHKTNGYIIQLVFTDVNDINKAFNNIRKAIYNNSTNITEITAIDILINN